MFSMAPNMEKIDLNVVPDVKRSELGQMILDLHDTVKKQGETLEKLKKTLMDQANAAEELDESPPRYKFRSTKERQAAAKRYRSTKERQAAAKRYRKPPHQKCIACGLHHWRKKKCPPTCPWLEYIPPTQSDEKNEEILNLLADKYKNRTNLYNDFNLRKDLKDQKIFVDGLMASMGIKKVRDEPQEEVNDEPEEPSAAAAADHVSSI